MRKVSAGMVAHKTHKGQRMTNSKNVIVINGKRYDAKTGKLLSGPVKPAASRAKNPGVVDGFKRRPTAKTPTSNSVHKKTDRSHTLMRTAVKKPASQKPKVSATTSHATKAAPKPNVATGHTMSADRERLERAQTIQKSSLISRFGTKTVDTIGVVKKAVTTLPVVPAPDNNESTSSSAHSSKTNSKSKKPDFESVINNARGHEETYTPPKKRRLGLSRRTTTILTGGFAVLLLGGFIVYQNIPNFAMRVAATRSGVNASMPGYKPAGFAINGPIQYSPGKIAVAFRSTTDDRNFTISQQSSQWNSESLLDNYVLSEKRAYQTYQDKGKTIYIYDESNATWVDKGVWYNIEGKSALSSDQLLRLANSL